MATAVDLLTKLKWEFSNMQTAKTKEAYCYHAFNFFVTGFHFADWFHPGDKTSQDSLKAHPILKICGHIANGAKHFQTFPNVVAVRSLAEEDYVESGYVEFGYFETLYVKLDKSEIPDHPSDTIGVCDFAKKVIAHWEGHLAKSARSS